MHNSEVKRYKSLYKKVILQAVSDAVTTKKSNSARYIKFQAKKWIFQDNEDFKQICGLAGMEPESVRKMALDMISSVSSKRKFLYKTTKDREYIMYSQA